MTVSENNYGKWKVRVWVYLVWVSSLRSKVNNAEQITGKIRELITPSYSLTVKLLPYNFICLYLNRFLYQLTKTMYFDYQALDINQTYCRFSVSKWTYCRSAVRLFFTKKNGSKIGSKKYKSTLLPIGSKKKNGSKKNIGSKKKPYQFFAEK